VHVVQRDSFSLSVSRLISDFLAREFYISGLFILVVGMLNEASASAKDIRGMGFPPPLSQYPLLHTLISNNTFDKPIPVSFSAIQFEQFERIIQDTNNMSSTSPEDCIITNEMSSPNVSSCNKPISSPCSQPPTLVNTKVQDFSNHSTPMEVDTNVENASRKRSLHSSAPENLGNIKPKKSSNEASSVAK